MIIVGVLLLLVLAVGGTLFFVLSPGSQQGATVAPDGNIVAPPRPLGPPLYVSLDPPFLMNFDDRGSLRYLQVNISVMTRENRVAEALNSIKPRLRNDLLELFARQNFNQITGPEGMANGMELLRNLASEALQNALATEIGVNDGIEAVYFTSFVMQ